MRVLDRCGRTGVPLSAYKDVMKNDSVIENTVTEKSDNECSVTVTQCSNGGSVESFVHRVQVKKSVTRETSTRTNDGKKDKATISYRREFEVTREGVITTEEKGISYMPQVYSSYEDSTPSTRFFCSNVSCAAGQGADDTFLNHMFCML